MTKDETSLVHQVNEIALKAGNAIMSIYSRDFSQSEKEDKSPLTEADLAAHEIIVKGLSNLSALPILSEEGELPAWETRSEWSEYWIIDPLDGTKEFIKRNGEFTVNIALIKNGKPVLGVVYAPALDTLYFASEDTGAHKLEQASQTDQDAAIKIQVTEKGQNWRVVGSRSHGSDRMEAFTKTLGDHEMLPMGSSLKLCMVAEGKADLYPRLAPTSEWDTAAAQAVVEYAGGIVLRDDLTQLRYNTKDSILNPHFIVAASLDSQWSKFFN